MKITHTPGFTPIPQPPAQEETFTLVVGRDEMRALLKVGNWPDLVSRTVMHADLFPHKDGPTYDEIRQAVSSLFYAMPEGFRRLDRA